ncbi:MAG: CapA family protein [Eubacterium sp.]|nr:CapA family protein [Eubacterium sp.]
MKRLLWLCLGACVLFTTGCGDNVNTGPSESADAASTAPEFPYRTVDEAWATDTSGDAALAAASGDAYSVAESVRPEETEITISFAGDCALGKLQMYGHDGTVEAYYDSYGPEYFFQNVRDVFEEDDLTVVNLECVLTEETQRVIKTYNIKGKPEYTSILTAGSIEAVSLGNNHSRDYGEKSLTDTEEALDEAGVAYAIEDVTAMCTTDDGVKIGLVSADLLYSDQERYVYEGIESLREDGADLVFALCHWGIEYQYYPTQAQQDWAHAFIDAGADAVIGCHPHVIESMEVYNGKVICYSLGNFSFGANRNPRDKASMIYQQTFTFVDGELRDEGIDARVIPCRLSGSTSYNDYSPVILEGDEGQQVLDRLNEYSSPYSGLHLDEDGTLSIED